MGFMEDIDKGLRNMGKKLEKGDKQYIRTDCPKCGAKDIRVHRMRARHGTARCPECGTHFVVMRSGCCVEPKS